MKLAPQLDQFLAFGRIEQPLRDVIFGQRRFRWLADWAQPYPLGRGCGVQAELLSYIVGAAPSVHQQRQVADETLARTLFGICSSRTPSV